jgi:hypothetical protein
VQIKDFRSLNCSKPGQCLGILISTSYLYTPTPIYFSFSNAPIRSSRGGLLLISWTSI